MGHRTLASGLTVVLLAGGAASEEPALDPGASLELRFELSRRQGDAEADHSVHTLRLTADDESARVSAGVEMPVWTVANDARTTVFMDIGTNVDCTAETLKDGRFRLPCEISQQTPYSGKHGWGRSSVSASSFALGDKPEIGMFGARSTLLLGDGQTARWVTATDPVTGEMIQVQATLKVLGGAAKARATEGKQAKPLELDVELNRRRDSTPTSRARYTLRLAADGGACELKTGVKSPIRNPDDMMTFKDQGVFIGCKPRALDDGRYRLSCEIRQNGPYSGRDDWAAMGAAVDSFSLGGASVARTLHLATVLYLRDGEAAEWTAGTDPVTGETVGIRLSLKALE